MLIRFKFKNYKCFNDEGVLDFTGSSEKRHSEDLIIVNNNKLLPVIAIHGANAAGKSTIFEAFECMLNVIKKSLFSDVNEDIPVKSFLFDEKSIQKPTEFEVSVYINKFEYRYGFSTTKEKILEEWLYKKSFVKNTRAKQHLIFERQENKTFFGEKYSKYEKIWNLYKKEINFNKLLILSVLSVKEDNGEIRDLFKDLRNIIIKKDEFKPEVSITILNDEKLHNEFSKIINEFDPCLKGIKVKTAIDEHDKKRYIINGIHIDSGNKEIEIPLLSESNGTIKMFNIVPSILLSLATGSLLCIDELDTKLHPLLFRKIIKMYADPKINQNKAQLVFTAHSTLVFNSNDLRRDEIYLVEKNIEGKSALYSLFDFRSLRGDADYEKKYLSGEFGAIPFLNDED